MKQMTLKELGWDHIDFGFDVKYVAGDKIDGNTIHWWVFMDKPYYDYEQEIWVVDSGELEEAELEPHPMAQFPEHTLIEIVEEV